VKEDVHLSEDDEDAMKVDTSFGGDREILQLRTVTPGASSDVKSPGIAQSSEAALEDVDVHMEDMDIVSSVDSEENINQMVDKPVSPSPFQSVTSPSSIGPIKSSIPFIHLGPSSPIQATPTPRPPVIILAPSTSTDAASFTFDESPFIGPEQQKLSDSPIIHRHQSNPDYTLPPLRKLPQEFNRKVKTKIKKKDKDKDSGKDIPRKEESLPMGIQRWVATLNANPVWKRVSRPMKCLSSREWAVRHAFTVSCVTDHLF